MTEIQQEIYSDENTREHDEAMKQFELRLPQVCYFEELDQIGYDMDLVYTEGINKKLLNSITTSLKDDLCIKNVTKAMDLQQRINNFYRLRTKIAEQTGRSDFDFWEEKLWNGKRKIALLESHPDILTEISGFQKRNIETRQYIRYLRRTYCTMGIDNCDEHIKQLLSSIYPFQRNKYIMGFYGGYFYPIDYQLYGIIDKMIQNGFIPGGWNYSEEGDCFFSILPNGEEFNKENMKILGNKIRDVIGKEIVTRKSKKSESDKVHITISKSIGFGRMHVSVMFEHTLIPKIEENLQVEPHNKTPLPGNADVAKICKIHETDNRALLRGLYSKRVNNMDVMGIHLKNE